jgi:hypothetical protein
MRRNETREIKIEPDGSAGTWRDSILDFEKNLVVPHFDSMSGDRFDGRHAQRLAGPDIKPSPVARALDLAAFKLALRQWTSIVGANVIDRVETAADVEQGDGPAVNIEQSLAPWRHLRAMGHFDWSWHG